MKNYLLAVLMLLCGFFPVNALAANIYTDIVLPSNAPPNSSAAITFRSMLPRDSDTNIIENASDGVVSSNWSPLTCKVRNGWARVAVTLYGNNWPSSFPSSATCVTTYGGVTYNLVVSISTRTVDYDNGVVTNYPSGGATFNLTAEDGLAGSLTNLPQVSGGYIQEANWALKGGSSWTGVKCRIVQNSLGYWFLVTEVASTASEGTGYCRVRKPGTPPTTTQVPVTVNRD